MEEVQEVAGGDEEQHSEGDTEPQPQFPEMSVLVSKRDHVPTPKLMGGVQQNQESS